MHVSVTVASTVCMLMPFVPQFRQRHSLGMHLLPGRFPPCFEPLLEINTIVVTLLQRDVRWLVAGGLV